MPLPPPVLNNRADVFALNLRPETKAVALWLLEHPPAVYERAEIAKALGMRPAAVEVAIVAAQKRHPFIFARQAPSGTPLRGRHAFIPSDAPIRKAWATPADVGPRALADDEISAQPGDPDLESLDFDLESTMAELTDTAKQAGENAYKAARARGVKEEPANEHATEVAVYTNAREAGLSKLESQAKASSTVAKMRHARAIEAAVLSRRPDDDTALPLNLGDLPEARVDVEPEGDRIVIVDEPTAHVTLTTVGGEPSPDDVPLNLGGGDEPARGADGTFQKKKKNTAKVPE